MADLFSFVGIGGAVLLIVACWLEARGRQTHTDRPDPDLAEGPRVTSRLPRKPGW